MGWRRTSPASGQPVKHARAHGQPREGGGITAAILFKLWLTQKREAVVTSSMAMVSMGGEEPQEPGKGSMKREAKKLVNQS